MERYSENILIVEDDPQISNFIRYTVQNEGFSCICAGNGATALKFLVEKQIQLLILDLGLPDLDGAEVLKRLREWSDMPVIIVSARDQDQEKADMLDMGADDYLTKPFSATELLARIRVAVRHLRRQRQDSQPSSWKVGGLSLDSGAHTAFLDGEKLRLTPMEFGLLQLLMKNAGKVLTTGYIQKEIWGGKATDDTQALRTMMAALRRKVERNPAAPRYILTEVGVGYRMAEE